MKNFGKFFLIKSITVSLLNRKQRFPILLIILITLSLSIAGEDSSFSSTSSNLSNHVFEEYPVIIKKYDIRIDIQGPDQIEIIEDIVFENKQNDSITAFQFWFNQTSYSNLAIIYDFEDLNYYNVTTDGLITIAFQTNITTNQTRSFSLTYDLNFRLPYVSEETYYFLPFDSFVNYYTEIHTVTIRLPQYYTLHEFEHGASSYIPEGVNPEFTGGRFYLSWMFSNLTPNTQIPFVVYFDEPFSRPIPIWTISLILTVGIVGGALSVYFTG